jgi:hypothetical protein
MKTNLAALRAVAVWGSLYTVQDNSGSIRAGDVGFPVGVDSGEGQSWDKSQPSKVCQVHAGVE